MAKVTATVYGDRTGKEIETQCFYAKNLSLALKLARSWFYEFGDGYGCYVSDSIIGAIADWHN